MPTVRLPDEQFERLKKYAVPLVDSVGDVLGRILDSYDPATRPVREINQDDFEGIWNILARKFNAMDNVKFYANPFPGKQSWAQIRTGRADIHYEWLMHKHEGMLDVALHFEASDVKVNSARLASFVKHSEVITKDITEEYRTRFWNKDKKFSEFALRIPSGGNSVVTEAAIERAAKLMRMLIDRSWDLVKDL